MKSMIHHHFSSCVNISTFKGARESTGGRGVKSDNAVTVLKQFRLKSDEIYSRFTSEICTWYLQLNFSHNS